MSNILEVLQSAQANVENMRILGFGLIPLVEAQLGNAIGLLEKGYPLDTDVDGILKHATVEYLPKYDGQ